MHSKSIITWIVLLLIIVSCNTQSSTQEPVKKNNWNERTANLDTVDSLSIGSSYLSVYSEIYSQNEERTHALTVTVSIRNPNPEHSIYLLKAEYFDTEGNLIRTYFEKPIFISPLETVEIIISNSDNEGGTGANFLFDWAVEQDTREPIFEAIMISTSGQQGISFVTQGVRIK